MTMLPIYPKPHSTIHHRIRTSQRMTFFPSFLLMLLIIIHSTMSVKLGYNIVESGSRGKIVVATRDFLPGETVLEEKEPLLFLPKELLQQYMRYDSTEMHIFWLRSPLS